MPLRSLNSACVQTLKLKISCSSSFMTVSGSFLSFSVPRCSSLGQGDTQQHGWRVLMQLAKSDIESSFRWVVVHQPSNPLGQPERRSGLWSAPASFLNQISTFSFPSYKTQLTASTCHPSRLEGSTHFAYKKTFESQGRKSIIYILQQV